MTTSLTAAASVVYAPHTRPRLRGVSHLAALVLALPLAAWLVSAAPTARAARAAAVYAASLVALFGVSALYHRGTWGPAGYARMRRLDHATIFVFIAGSYTPIAALGVGGDRGALLLWVSWLGAALGVAQSLLWVHAPRALTVALYLALGWVGAIALAPLHARTGATGVALLCGGGALYTLGAVIYARKRPDPVPHVFGFHELFHALVITACAALFELVRRCVALG